MTEGTGMHCQPVQGRLPDGDVCGSVEWDVLWTVLVALLSIQHSGLVKEMMRWDRTGSETVER